MFPHSHYFGPTCVWGMNAAAGAAVSKATAHSLNMVLPEARMRGSVGAGGWEWCGVGGQGGAEGRLPGGDPDGEP